jgi:hypothetical protein
MTVKDGKVNGFKEYRRLLRALSTPKDATTKICRSTGASALPIRSSSATDAGRSGRRKAREYRKRFTKSGGYCFSILQ